MKKLINLILILALISNSSIFCQPKKCKTNADCKAGIEECSDGKCKMKAAKDLLKL